MRVAPRASLAAAIVLIAASGACTSDDDPEVTITVAEWQVMAAPAEPTAAAVPVAVDNEGDQAHQLLLVEAPADGAALPTLPTGEVDLAAAIVVDEIGPFDPGRYDASFLRVLPGEYVLLCNLVTDGTSHYAQGMSAMLTVATGADVEPAGS